MVLDIPKPASDLVPDIPEPASDLVSDQYIHTADKGLPVREKSLIAPSSSALAISGEDPSAMTISEEGLSTSYDPPTVIILGPIPETEPTFPKPEPITMADPPAVVPVALSPPVDLTPFLEEVGSDPQAASPADPFVSEHYRPLKESLLAILDRHLDSFAAEDFTSIGQILRDLLSHGIPNRFIATALESTASRLS